MKKIKITTDTASDISPETAEKFGIHLIPINLTIDGKDYKDRYDISPKEFFELLPSCSDIPKTAQVTVTEHMEHFKKFCDEYSIIHISISANASGTNQSAHLAANEIREENPDADITILDPASFSYGYGLYVIEAAKMVQIGAAKEDIISYLKGSFEKCCVLFFPETLEYLQKGGRISSGTKILANVLDITPILTIENGLVTSKDKVRGRKKVFGKIADMVSEDIDTSAMHKIAIMHGNSPENAEKIKEKLIEKTGIEDYDIEILGPTIGIHAGPGAVGVIYQKK